MRTLIVALTIVAAASPALAQTGRFAPDNPWFQHFEETCRDGYLMHEECQGGVLGAFAEYAGTENIRCDFELFWRVKDTKSSDYFNTLPWQYGVEFIIQETGVCEVI